MPMKLNVGLCKKQGQPDFGSLGASCSVELELDSFLLRHDLAAFHEHVRNAYAACSQAVNDELARHRISAGTAVNIVSSPSVPPVTNTPTSNGNGAGTGNHTASQKQLDYLQQLARQIKGLGVRRLDELAQRMFSKPLAGVSSLEASSLIDSRKAIKAGQINLEDILSGATS
ncbi:MAG: hypothetical protein FJ276_22540, partial [Planctomycetes bacterium]|nr:hypothetical protein [Planctomycetota bacterium]